MSVSRMIWPADASRTTVYYEEPVTVVLMDVEDEQFIGIARCKPTDKYSKEIGEILATARALNKMANFVEKQAIDLVSTKRDWQQRHPDKNV